MGEHGIDSNGLSTGTAGSGAGCRAPGGKTTKTR